MISKNDISESELTMMIESGVDIDLALSILNNYNDGLIGRTAPVIPKAVPLIDGDQILDLRNPVEFTFTDRQLSAFRQRFPQQASVLKPGERSIGIEKLKKIGISLFSYYSYGFLNGGSATSYADTKKNKGFNPDLFDLYEETFNRMASLAKGQPKGVTAAFIQPDGSPGPSYMELKLRSLLIYSEKSSSKIPFFQMTSVSNNDSVQSALAQYSNSPWLKALAKKLDHPIWKGLSGIQPMICAYSHSREGDKKNIFRGSDPEKAVIIPLPGGHGQSFRVLKDTFIELYNRGIRFISLGNIDNLGYTADPLSLAILALKGNPAGFDFSFKTAVDVKGGILIKDESDNLNCVDLGVGISKDEAAAMERRGEKILFNCATGLFDLSWLMDNIDYIIEKLPLRFSDQNKDAGLYSQAEQVTWEVIAMIDKPLIFGIDKYKRFLAAKMLLENLLTSGLKLDDPAFPGGTSEGSLKDTGRKLYEGMQYLLTHEYGLTLKEGKWLPREE